MNQPSVLCLCEVHWRPLRRCILDLAAQGQGCDVLLRGPLVPDTLPMVPAHPAIRHRVVARPWFMALGLWAAGAGTLTGRYDRVLMDKPKLAARLRWLPWVRRRCAVVHADAALGYRMDTSCGSP